jgi:serine/threonine-protein kinase RsbW
LPPDDSLITQIRRDGLDGPQHLETVHEALRELWAAGAALFTDARWRTEFDIAVAEIAANVARHVASHAEGLSFSMQLTLRSEQADALFEDPGRAVVLPAEIAAPDMYAEAGRGLALAQQCLDVLQYERDGDLNRWYLVKCRGA